MIKKIVTGGQTGVDRAALDASIALGISYGGWCPKGRIDELGIIPPKYNQLTEISIDSSNEADNYNVRTKQNIIDSDGTLIIVPTLPLSKHIKDGTLLTIDEATLQKKPYLLMSLSTFNKQALSNYLTWVNENNIQILNIAGPRESSCKDIYEESYKFLLQLLAKQKNEKEQLS